MISVALSNSTDQKLQLIARPFESREALIDRMADAELARRRASANEGGMQPSPPSVATLAVPPHSPPSLTHTRVISAFVDGRPVNEPDWNRLLAHVHVLAHRKLGSPDAVAQASTANVRTGKHTADGYRYLPHAGISLQGVDANKAWAHSLKLAHVLGVGLSVTFVWRDREDAAHPGNTGSLCWEPPHAVAPKDIFAEMAPFTVAHANVDDSRESVYHQRPGE